MKKIVLTSLLSLIFTTTVMAQDIKRDAMIDLASFATESSLTIEGWQVTIKEKMDIDKLLNIIEQMKDSHLATVTEDENVIKYSFGGTNDGLGVSQHYYAIIPTNKKVEPELIAIIKGELWDNSTKKDYETMYLSVNQHYFTKSAKRYACLNATNGAIIRSVNIFKEINEYFNLKHVSTQIDTVKQMMSNKIIYGYTPLWKQKVEVMGEPINIQIAIKNTDNGHSKITIGTPILINEY